MMKRDAVVRALLGAFVVLSGGVAVAAPTQNDNSGQWLDAYQDNSGLTELTDVSFIAASQLLTLTPGEDAGHFTTQVIHPASFAGWEALYVKYSASAATDVRITFKGPAGAAVECAFDSVACPIVASDDPAWQGKIDLSTLSLTDFPEATVRVDLQTSFVPPTIQALRVDWEPRSVVTVSAETTTPSACTRATLSYKVRVAVSHVDATDLVVYAPLPEGVFANPFGGNTRLEMVDASDGGRYNAGASAIDVRGVSVPAYSVYWDLGARKAGNTFALSFNARSPVGVLNGTSYTLRATAQAANSDPRQSGAVTAVLASSGPAPYITKSVSGTFPLFGSNYVDPQQTVTYSIYAANQNSSTCRTDYHRVVVWDRLDALKLPNGTPVYAGSIANISSGGQLTGASPVTLYGAATDGSAITIPANSIYWDLGTLSPGAGRSMSFSITLQSAPPLATAEPKTVVTNTATMNSGYAPHHAGDRSASATFKVGIPFEPDGYYAKGDKIRGSTGVSAGEDNSQRTVGYGEPFGWVLYATNRGASALTNTVMLDKVPDGTTFASAFLPGGVNGTIWYTTAGGTNDISSPPGYDAATGTLTGWSNYATSPPSDPSAVRWVAFTVPRLASTFFQESGVLSSAQGEINVTVNQPSGSCPEITLTNRGLFHTYGYTTPTGGGGNQHLSTTNDEHVVVKPLVPYLQLSSYASPSVILGAGETTFSVNLSNRDPNGNQVDTALDALLTINLPTAVVNGVQRQLEVVSVSKGGGQTIEESANRVVLKFPTINPSETKSVSIRLRVPKGFVNDASFTLTSSATAHDDVCGNANSVSSSATATVRGTPNLQVTKATDLAVAAPGSYVNYTLSYVNTGETVSTRSWLVDRVPANTVFVSADAPANRQRYWFSQAQAPALPASLRDAFTWTDAIIRTSGLFAPGVVGGDGRVTSPFGSATTYVAVSIDDPDVSPPQLTTQENASLRSVRYRVQMSPTATTGALAANQAAIFSSELLLAISNQVVTIIAPNPSLGVTRSCPQVVANGEAFDVVTQYANNSSNDDETVTIVENLPAEAVFVGADWAAGGQTGTAAGSAAHFTVADVTDPDSGAVTGHTVTWDVTGTLGRPLRSLETARLTLHLHVEGGESGMFTLFSGLGTAENAASPISASLYSSCSVLVQNPDLWARKTADITDPLPGQEVSFTLLVSNEGAHAADNVIITDTLPPQLEYVSGSATVLTSGWYLPAPPAVDPVTGALVWSVAKNNALVYAPSAPASPLAPGTLPGASGTVRVSLKARVRATTVPGTSFENCLDLALGAVNGAQIVEDLDYENHACVTLRTPLPDPWVTKTAPALAQPGDAITYRLSYGNGSRADAPRVVLIDPLYDDPTPATDGVPDVTVLGVTAPNGEEVFFSAAPLGATAPTFDADAADPPGWSRALTSLGAPASWVAVRVANVPGLASPRSVFVDVELRNPVTHVPPQPGDSIVNCVTAAMRGANAPVDDDPSNNSACATTRTPGIDVSLTHDCSPEGAFPGVLPGGTVTLTLTLSNSGTEAAHGLKIHDALPDWFEPLGDDAVNVVVTDAAGAPAAAIDATGLPLPGAVPWTRVGDDYVLGSDDPTSPLWYRRVGLASGQKTSVIITGTVGLGVASGTAITNTGTALVDYREDWVPGDPAEEDTANNVASCGTVVVRPDPVVLKFAADAAGGQGPVALGQRIVYTVEYNNIGLAAADVVSIEDILPNGTAFVVGSLANVPEGVDVEYAGLDGAWGYTPVGATGATDPQVTAFRLVWQDPLRAPTNSYFHQTTALDFANGVFQGTHVDTALDAVVVGGAGATSSGAAFLSPIIPGDDEGSVVAWGSILAETTNAGDDDKVVYDVLDPDTHAPIPGYTGLETDGSGAVDISSLDPGQHERIQLRARFQGGAITNDPTSSAMSTLSTLFPKVARSEAWAANDRDEVAVVLNTSRERNDGVVRDDNTCIAIYSQDEGGEWQPEILPLVEQTFHGGYVINTFHPNRVVEFTDKLLVVNMTGRDVQNYYGWLGVGMYTRDDNTTSPRWESTGYIHPNNGNFDFRDSDGEGVVVGIMDRSADGDGAQILIASHEPRQTYWNWNDQSYVDSAADCEGLFVNGSGLVATSCAYDYTWTGLAVFYGTDYGSYREWYEYDLPELDLGDPDYRVAGVSDDDVIAGHVVDFDDGSSRVITWRPQADDPYSFDVFTANAGAATASDIVARRGDDGHYLGSARLNGVTVPGVWFPTAFDPSGLVFVPATYEGASNVVLRDVDATGRAVGYVQIGGGELTPVIWTPSGGDLPVLTGQAVDGGLAGGASIQTAYDGAAVGFRAGGNAAWQLRAPLYPTADLADVYTLRDGRPDFTLGSTVDDYQRAALWPFAKADGGSIAAEVLPELTFSSGFVAAGVAGGGFIGYSINDDNVSVPGVDDNTTRVLTVWSADPAAPGGWAPSPLEAGQGLQVVLSLRDGVVIARRRVPGWSWLYDYYAVATDADGQPSITQLPRPADTVGFDYISTYDTGRGAVMLEGETYSPEVGYERWYLYRASATSDAWYAYSAQDASGIVNTAYPEASLGDVAIASGSSSYQRVVAEVRDGQSRDGHTAVELVAPASAHTYFHDLSPAGHVSGYYRVGNYQHAVVWRRTGQKSWQAFDLHVSGNYSYAYEVTDDIVITQNDADATTNGYNRLRAWEWSGDAYTRVNLPLVGGRAPGYDFDQNARRELLASTGQILGSIYTDQSQRVPVVYYREEGCSPDADESRCYRAVELPVGEGTNESYIYRYVPRHRLFIGYTYIDDYPTPVMWRDTSTSGPPTYELFPLVDGFRGNFYFRYQDSLDVSPSGVFFVTLREYSANRYYMVAIVPDETAPSGFTYVSVVSGTQSADTMDLLGDSECWAYHRATVNGGFEAAPDLGGTSSGKSTGPQIWGCGVGSASSLDAWSVIYRTNRNPSFGYQLAVKDVCQESVTNTATISTNTPEITSSNNSSSATTAIATADVAVALTASQGTAVTGDGIEWQVTVSNGGPAAARDVVVDFTAPEGTDGEPERWTIASLAAGQSRTFYAYGEVTSESNGVALVAVANVASADIDCGTANDTASATTITGNLPNAYVRKTGPASVRLREPFSYTVTYGANGNVTSYGVQVDDALPTPFILTSGDQNGTAWDPYMPPGEQQSITVTGRVDDCALVGQTIKNTATLTVWDGPGEPGPDSSFADNAASVTTTLLAPAAALTLNVLPSRDTVTTGETLTYTLYFRNDSAVTVAAPVLEATLPAAGATLRPASFTTPATNNGTKLSWQLADVAPGGNGSVTFTLDVTGTPGGTGKFTTTASATSSSICPASVTSPATTFSATKGLRIVKSASTNAACSTGEVTWNLTVTNPDATAATNIVVTDTLTSGLSYVGGSITGPGAQAAGAPALLWNVGTIRAGEGITLTYRTRAPVSAGALATNVAYVERNGVRVATAAAAALRVDCDGTLALDKSWDGTCAQPGQAVKVTLRYKNRGSATLTGVKVVDPVMPGFTNIVPANGGTLANSAVTWSITSLAPGAAADVSYTATIDASAARGQLVLDRAVATAANALPQTSNQIAGVVLMCDDGNTCTTDTCSMAAGCVNTLTPNDLGDATCDGVDDNC
ncbi:MAG: DUF11 domain-containing protein, partial [Myxococcales bacterium]|nr:DUF11 domain-containing protein [Myxococcales bacterium]